MIRYLERALNLRREELPPALLLFAYLFLVIAFYTMGQAVGDALFLNAFPDYLPQAIIGTAVFSGIFVSVYIRLLNRFRFQRVITGTLLFYAASFVIFWISTRHPARFEYPLIYVWVSTAAVVGTSSGWTMANFVLTTREARRVFGFIGAGAILGGMFGGFTTKAATGYVRSETLLLVLAVLMTGCAVVASALFRIARRRMHGADAAVVAGARQQPRTFRESLSLITHDRYLLLITALVGVGCGATTIIGYQFKMIAKETIRNKAQLAAFFGAFYGYMGIASFVLQLLITGRLLRSVGIRVTLFILPFVFFAGSLGVLLIPTLLMVSVLRGSQNLLRYSLDRSSTELLYLPVSPGVKSQVKSFIDVFIYRVADGIAGAVLWVFANRLNMRPSTISMVNFAFLGGWIIAAWAIRREYLNVLRRAIERRTLDPERTAAGVLDRTTSEALGHALESGDEQQILYSLSLFEMSGTAGAHPALRRLLAHPAAPVRHRALRMLAEAGDRTITADVEKLVRDTTPEVRAEAIHYLVVHEGRDPISLLGGDANLPDYAIQGSMVAYLARTGRPENFSAAEMILDSMLAREGEVRHASRAEGARVLGVIPPPSPLHVQLHNLLRDDDAAVLEQAIVSAGRVGGLEFLPPIILHLEDRRLVGAARTALLQYGERAIGTLHDYLNDAAVPAAVRRHIPGVLAHIPTPRSVDALVNSIIQSDAGLRFDVVKALNKIRRREPALLPPQPEFEDLLLAELMGYYRSLQILAALDERALRSRRAAHGEHLLVRALRERMEHELERIFRLLGLLYAPRDIHNAYVGFTTGRPQVEANALEVLENLVRPDLYRALAYILDPEVTPAERLQFARQYVRAGVESRREAIRILLRSEDRWLAACALHEVGTARLRDLQGDLRPLLAENDSLLRETAEWATAQLNAAAGGND